MKVLVLTPHAYDTAPGTRFRIEQWARHLGREGFEFTFAPFEDDTLHEVLYRPRRYIQKTALMLRALARRFRVLAPMRDADLVFLHREAALIGPAIIESLIARHGPPVVYDFDDPIWLPYRSPMNGFFSRFKWPTKTAAICRQADMVIVGNRLLGDWARKHARHVHVVPSTIDIDRCPPKVTNGQPQTLTLGWTGSHSTLPFLQLLQHVLRRLAGKYAFRLLVISQGDAPPFDDMPFEMTVKTWSAASEGLDLQEMDIGLAPFPNRGWTPWRCHGKVLQYMAAAVPTVASPVGIMPDYIENGVNGFLAETEDDWLEKLSILMENPGLRQQMGGAARQTIVERYSAQVWLPKVRELFESVVANGKNGRKTRDQGLGIRDQG